MAFIPMLYRVQEIETRLNALNRSEQELNQNPNLKSLQQLTEEIDRIIVLNDKKNTENRSVQKRIENELQECLEHCHQEETLLYSGKISNPRELEQIQQKMSEYRQLQDKLETQLFTILEADELLKNEKDQIQNRLEQCSREFADERRIIREKTLEIKLEKEELQAELDLIKPQIPTQWLERYRKIADSHRGIGIAKLKNNVCGACHVSLSDSLLKKVKQGDDLLHFCENCGRIIYY